MEPLLILRAVLLIAAGYVIGGIPWGVIVAKVSGGTDPRTIGSGRTGGANTMRAIGPRLALTAGLLDMLKGTAAVLLARALGAGVAVEVLAGRAAIIGPTPSPVRGVGGGRGVLRGGAGVIASPRYSSLGSLTGSAFGGILFAIVIATQGLDPFLYVYAIGGTGLVWLFHWDNIGRLLRGEERKIGTPRPEG